MTSPTRRRPVRERRPVERADAPPSIPDETARRAEGPTGAAGTTERTANAAASRVQRNVWSQRASREEVAQAARVQEFEARRAAAEASAGTNHASGQEHLDEAPAGADLSPIDRLLAEREAASRTSHTAPERDLGQ